MLSPERKGPAARASAADPGDVADLPAAVRPAELEAEDEGRAGVPRLRLEFVLPLLPSSLLLSLLARRRGGGVAVAAVAVIPLERGRRIRRRR